MQSVCAHAGEGAFVGVLLLLRGELWCMVWCVVSGCMCVREVCLCVSSRGKGGWNAMQRLEDDGRVDMCGKERRESNGTRARTSEQANEKDSM